MKHLIIHADKDMKLLDWTPFENKNSTNTREIIKTNDLITEALDKLSNYGWKLKQVFILKGPHFLLTKNELKNELKNGLSDGLNDELNDGLNDGLNDSNLPMYSTMPEEDLYDHLKHLNKDDNSNNPNKYYEDF